MDPARDFRTLIRQKTVAFGEGEIQFLWRAGLINISCGCVINHRDSCSALVIVFIFLFGCGDLRVLSSLSATDSQDRAVA